MKLLCVYIEKKKDYRYEVKLTIFARKIGVCIASAIKFMQIYQTTKTNKTYEGWSKIVYVNIIHVCIIM